MSTLLVILTLVYCQMSWYIRTPLRHTYAQLLSNVSVSMQLAELVRHNMLN